MTDAKRIDVLDHGYVRLVDSMGGDLSIVRAARVSHGADWRAGSDEGSDERLINYLWRNRHTTPFEAVTLQFEVAAPIFVLRQWMRHRTWSYNEISARYTKIEDKFYVPQPEHIGMPSKHNKQGREIGWTNPRNQMDQAKLILESCEEAFSAYHRLLTQGVPRELARIVLPVATYSRMYATANLRNLLAFLDERLHPHAQYEIRVYAEALLALVAPIAPVAIEAWKAGRKA